VHRTWGDAPDADYPWALFIYGEKGVLKASTMRADFIPHDNKQKTIHFDCVFEKEKFPEDNPVFGFITWRWILTPGFDHMFSSPVFLGLLALLAASLMACTYTTQLPMVKVARRYSKLLLFVYATAC